MIKYGLLIGVLGMYVCVTTSSACTLQYEPVCGTDGKTYSNSCFFGLQKRNNPNLKVAHNGPCIKDLPLVHDRLKRSAKECKYGAKIVCGTNGVTYENPCLMNHAGNKTHHVKLSHFGPCNDTAMEKVKEIMDNKTSIAAEHAQNKSKTEILNNTTHVHTQNSNEVQNLGMAPNAQKQNKTDINLQHSKDQKQNTSEAENPTIELSCPACGLELHELCGNDGVTYGNPCLLKCAARLNSTLEVHFEGRCEGGKLIVQVSESDDIQEDTANNVKNTTQNMQNATNAEKKTKTDKYGKVRKQRDLQMKSELLCACPKNIHKVCSTDGVTYLNLCLLKCAAINNTNIQLKHDGSCDSEDRHSGIVNNTQGTDNEEVSTENHNQTDVQVKKNNSLLHYTEEIDNQHKNNEVPENSTQAKNPKNAALTAMPVEDTKNNTLEPDVDTKELEQQDGLVGSNNSSCSCPTEIFPVCGTNGVTYDNLCFLKCAAISDKTIEVKREGACDAIRAKSEK